MVVKVHMKSTDKMITLYGVDAMDFLTEMNSVRWENSKFLVFKVPNAQEDNPQSFSFAVDDISYISTRGK